MAEPSLESSRRRLALVAVGVVLLLVLAGVIYAAVRGRTPAEGASAPPDPIPVVVAPPAPPLPPPPAGRADILAAVAAAVAAHAAGEPPPSEQAELVGRRFELRIPFGCQGPATEVADGLGRVEFDAARRTLRLIVQPQSWTDAPLAASAGEDVEAVEGFWLPRPWSMSEACPPQQSAAQPASPASEIAEGKQAPPTAAPAARDRETVGLAAFYRVGGSRLLRRGTRPYEAISRLPEDVSAMPADGFRLVLSGRLTGYAPTELVRCQSGSAYQRPVCLVAVEFDRVAIESPADGRTLAEWRS